MAASTRLKAFTARHPRLVATLVMLALLVAAQGSAAAELSTSSADLIDGP